MKQMKYILPAVLVALSASAFVSCSDMLDMGNDDVLYTDQNTLKSANDTVNTFAGILYQLQKIGVRTNLYGELRGDLTTVLNTADTCLQDIADFNVTSNNTYNNPRDYYAVINNCNYFLANADATLSETRYINNMPQDYYVLRAEWVAVRAIRAWLYLQLGQIYGENIPVVEEPLITTEDSENALNNADKRMNLQQICDHFIQDLEPYVSWFDYPYHGNPGRTGYSGSTPSRLSVFPIQLVLGDLYLWLSSITGDNALARKAAKCYYDYIVWVPNASGENINNTGYKKVNLTGYQRDYWYMEDGRYSSRNSYNYYEPSWYRTSSFGQVAGEVIAAIAMDSVAAESHFNSLRYFYSWNSEDGETPSCLVPSQPCIDYSDSQVYGDYYKSSSSPTATFVVKEPESIPEDMRQEHFVGDIRLGANHLSNGKNSNNQSLSGIYKSYATRDVIIYRTADVYLRMAEALNYAGFPVFAKYILTLGLDERVINNLVLSQCDNPTDSAFIQQFNFPRNVTGGNGFRTQLSENTTINNPVNSYYPVNPVGGSPQAFNNLEYVSQIGIHQRGSGNAYENPYYYPAEVDTIPNDPAVLKDGKLKPVQPSVYVAPLSSPTVSVSYLNELKKNNAELIIRFEAATGITPPELDTKVLPVEDWPTAVATYGGLLREFGSEEQAQWRSDLIDWQRVNAHLLVARQTEVVDSLLDIESALETCFEGFRFGYLMRADYRCGGRSRKMGGGRTYAQGEYLAERVGKRNPALQSLLMNRNKWFIGWKDNATGASIGVQ